MVRRAPRSLSLSDFGSLALLLGLGMMMTVLTDLGLTGILADLVAAEPARAQSGARIVVKQRIILACAASLLTGVAFVLAVGLDEWYIPAVFAASTIASAVYSTYTAVFRATGHAGYEAANEAVSRTVMLLVGSVVVLFVSSTLLAVVLVYVVVDLLSLLVLGIVFVRSTLTATLTVDRSRLSLRAARTLAAAGVVSTFYFRIDSWLLAMIQGERIVGRYTAAYRCFDALLLPTLAVSSLSIPYTTGLEGRTLHDRLRNISLFAAAVTLPFAVVMFVGAEPLVDVVFGSKYTAAVPAFRVLAVGAVVSAAVGAVLPPLALRSGRVAGALFASLVLNVVANLLVIPAYGALGAAAVTVGCELVLGLWIAMQVGALGRCAPTDDEPARNQQAHGFADEVFSPAHTN